MQYHDAPGAFIKTRNTHRNSMFSPRHDEAADPVIDWCDYDHDETLEEEAVKYEEMGQLGKRKICDVLIYSALGNRK
ncbi:uncharacterized protein PHACADRAFT_265631 [Phanerochaete carnosa HHB-10118-sp]|uniref:Uncharacterized protein n=1 Tax=Phanerochaete carnosa (strain HHB-10118-sp) TaxID=650164 RepID=K5VSY8_PHACS|nr:uncharacterized protein PHACADRAFT_265631 [Phanerochaete carnosa HHB-10118-sp]EKM49880.1 hypothetical protein PHACADRAFT_265631 [Phanerochaete carnosa HHB-10118-sp]